MEPGILNHVTGFVFPNEIHVYWSVMIVMYPYITGLVAGAFIVSSLYHLFGTKSLKPIARFALVSSFVFLIFAPLPLLMHLGFPQRAFSILITPSSTSAMAGFGVIYLVYMVIVVLELWFSLREDIVKRAQVAKGFAGFLLRAVVMFDLSLDERTRALDHKVVKFLAAVGIPVACFLHGYVGFLFGSIKANPWWSTPLMFVIFLLSAIVSGIAVLIFLFFVFSWLRRVTVERDVVKTMAGYLWGFMMLDVVLEIMEILSAAYKQTAEWQTIEGLIKGKLFVTYIVIQLLICSLVPFLLLGLNSVVRLKDKVSNFLVFSSSILLLVQVLMMRWNVVIGGQLMSKSFRGYTSYTPGIWNREGLVMAFVILIAPFLLLRLVDGFVPLFPPDSALGKWYLQQRS